VLFVESVSVRVRPLVTLLADSTRTWILIPQTPGQRFFADKPRAQAVAPFTQLWRVEKEYRESDPAFSAFVRCVICCFGNEGEWEQDNSGEETPLWFSFSILKKFIQTLGKSSLSIFDAQVVPPTEWVRAHPKKVSPATSMIARFDG
jgi:hypothetical protein